MAGVLFEDIFNVKDIDPEGKKFDRGESTSPFTPRYVRERRLAGATAVILAVRVAAFRDLADSGVEHMHMARMASATPSVARPSLACTSVDMQRLDRRRDNPPCARNIDVTPTPSTDRSTAMAGHSNARGADRALRLGKSRNNVRFIHLYILCIFFLEAKDEMRLYC